MFTEIRLIIFLFIFSFSQLNAQLPSADSVLFKLYSEYEAETGGWSGWKLAKTPRGYEIYITEVSEGSEIISDPILFYSRSSGQYKPIPPIQRKTPITDREELKKLGMKLHFGDRYGFERCPFYGYPQWSWDVIQEYGRKQDLTDLELEGLSRAYQSYSQGYVWGANSMFQSNAKWPSRNFKIGDSLPKGNIDSFLYYTKLETETIQQLVERNPNYQVIVGTIKNKLANEYMDIALNLAEYGHFEPAVEYARKAEYGKDMLAYARHILDMAPSKALILTNGDNDTYPVWYLQLTEQYRTDVVVMNMSLMPLVHYCSMFTSGKSPFGAIKAEFFERNGSRFGVWAHPANDSCRSNGKSYTGDEFLDYYYSTLLKAEETAPSFPCRNIDVRYQDGTTGYRLNEYYTTGDLMLIDFIQTSGLPVYYTYPGESESKNWAGRTEKGNGWLINGIGQNSDLEQMTDWYLNKFKPVQPEPGRDYETDKTSTHFCSHYLGQIGQIISYAYDQNKTENIEKLTHLALHIFPDGKMHPSYSWSSVAMALLWSKNEQEAIQIIEYLKNYHHNREYPELVSSKSHPNEIPALDTLMNAGEQLITIQKWLDSANLYSEINQDIHQFLKNHPQ